MNAYDYYLKHFRDELGFTQSQSAKAIGICEKASEQTGRTCGGFVFASSELAKLFRVFPSQKMLLELSQFAMAANVSMSSFIRLSTEI